jgi:hypothetical protein
MLPLNKETVSRQISLIDKKRRSGVAIWSRIVCCNEKNRWKASSGFLYSAGVKGIMRSSIIPVDPDQVAASILYSHLVESEIGSI